MRKNSGKIGNPRGNGLYVWLNEQICLSFEDGTNLVEQSRERKQAHHWLISQLQTQSISDQYTQELLEAFYLRRSNEEIKDSWRRKKAELASLERLEESLQQNDPKTYLNKRITKLRKALKKYEEQQKIVEAVVPTIQEDSS